MSMCGVCAKARQNLARLRLRLTSLRWWCEWGFQTLLTRLPMPVSRTAFSADGGSPAVPKLDSGIMLSRRQGVLEGQTNYLVQKGLHAFHRLGSDARTHIDLRGVIQCLQEFSDVWRVL